MENDSPFNLDSYELKTDLDLNNSFGKININIDTLILLIIFLLLIIMCLHVKDDLNYPKKIKSNEDNIPWI